MARLVALRHAEALKNRASYFGGGSAMDALTAEGQTSAAARHGLLTGRDDGIVLLSSPAQQARDTAGLLSGPGVTVRVDPRLCPISPGTLGGVSSADAERAAPSLVANMDRYRQGLYNGYDLVIPGGEAVVEFEARVLSWLGEVRAGATSDVWIMTHRSVVTALTIHFARQVFGYPVDFYGYIDVPLLGGLVVEGFEGDPGPNGVYIVDDLESVVR